MWRSPPTATSSLPQFVQTFGDIDFVTIRYKSSDGSVVWGPILTDGDGHGDDIVGLLALGFDGTGNVVLGGTPRCGRTRHPREYAARPATLWGPFVGGPDNRETRGFR